MFLKRLPLPRGAGGPVTGAASAGAAGPRGLSRRSSWVWGSCAALGTAGRILGSFELIKAQLNGMDRLFVSSAR